MTTSASAPQGWVPELTFPARLAVVRNRMGWNAKEAALACGLPAQSWRNWEAGTRPHDYIQVCEKIAARTGANLEWLVGVGPFGTSQTPNPGLNREYAGVNDGVVEVAA
jgi:DNA-binding XRE family transcriptional regulator